MEAEEMEAKKQYACEYCSYSTDTMSILKLHIRSSHKLSPRDMINLNRRLGCDKPKGEVTEVKEKPSQEMDEEIQTIKVEDQEEDSEYWPIKNQVDAEDEEVLKPKVALRPMSPIEFFDDEPSYVKKENEEDIKVTTSGGIWQIDLSTSSDNAGVKVDEEYRIEIREVDGKKVKTVCCTKCKFTSKVKHSVINHLKVVHYGIKPYRCSECPYATGFKGNLKTHSVTHLKVQDTKSEPENNVECGPNPTSEQDKMEKSSHGTEHIQSDDSKDEDTSKPTKVEFKDNEYDAEEDKSHKEENLGSTEKAARDKGNRRKQKLEPKSDEVLDIQDQIEIIPSESKSVSEEAEETVEPVASVMSMAERMRMRNLAAAEYFRKMKEEHARNEREKAREQLDKEVEKHPSTSTEKAQQSTFYHDKAKESIEGSLGNDGAKQQIDQHFEIEVIDHDGKETKLFKCVFKCNYPCGFSTKHKQSIMTHIKGVHLGIKPFRCNECPYASCYKQKLIGHLKKEHDGRQGQSTSDQSGQNEDLVPHDAIDKEGENYQDEHEYGVVPESPKPMTSLDEHLRMEYEAVDDAKSTDGDISEQPELDTVASPDSNQESQGLINKENTINEEDKEILNPTDPEGDELIEEENKAVKSPDANNKEQEDLHEHYKTEVLEQDDKKITLFKCIFNKHYICSFSTKRKNSILTHIKGTHFGIKPFKCNECPFATTTKYILVSHQRKDHGKIQDQSSDIEIATNEEGEEVYNCTMCDYSAKKIGNVKKHIPWHSKGLLKSQQGRKRGGSKEATSEILQKKLCEDESPMDLTQPVEAIKTLKCSHCNFAASTIDDMGDHMQSEHVMQTMSPMKEENLSNARDKINNIKKENEPMDEAPTTVLEFLQQETSKDTSVKEKITEIKEEEPMVPLKSVDIQNDSATKSGKKANKSGPKNKETMYCQFCSFKTVQRARLWKHVKNIHNDGSESSKKGQDSMGEVSDTQPNTLQKDTTADKEDEVGDSKIQNDISETFKKGPDSIDEASETKPNTSQKDTTADKEDEAGDSKIQNDISESFKKGPDSIDEASETKPNTSPKDTTADKENKVGDRKKEPRILSQPINLLSSSATLCCQFCKFKTADTARMERHMKNKHTEGASGSLDFSKIGTTNEVSIFSKKSDLQHEDPTDREVEKKIDTTKVELNELVTDQVDTEESITAIEDFIKESSKATPLSKTNVDTINKTNVETDGNKTKDNDPEEQNVEVEAKADETSLTTGNKNVNEDDTSIGSAEEKDASSPCKQSESEEDKSIAQSTEVKTKSLAQAILEDMDGDKESNEEDDNMDSSKAVPRDKDNDKDIYSEAKSDEAMEAETQDDNTTEPTARLEMTPAKKMRMRNLAAAEYFRKKKEEHERREREKQATREQLETCKSQNDESKEDSNDQTKSEAGEGKENVMPDINQKEEEVTNATSDASKSITGTGDGSLKDIERMDPKPKITPSNDKPQLTYAQLITEALMQANDMMMPLSDIYTYINQEYPSFHMDAKSWKMAIRTNLSRNKKFQKVPMNKKARGSLWTFANVSGQGKVLHQDMKVFKVEPKHAEIEDGIYTSENIQVKSEGVKLEMTGCDAENDIEDAEESLELESSLTIEPVKLETPSSNDEAMDTDAGVDASVGTSIESNVTLETVKLEQQDSEMETTMNDSGFDTTGSPKVELDDKKEEKSTAISESSPSSIELGPVKNKKCPHCDFEADKLINLIRHKKSKHRDAESQIVLTTNEDKSQDLQNGEPEYATSDAVIAKAICESNKELMKSDNDEAEKDIESCIKSSSPAQDNEEHSEEGQAEEHVKATFNDMNTKVFNCTKCNYSAKARNITVRHIKSVHFRLRPFKCEECSYNSSSKWNLDSHKKIKHGIIKDKKTKRKDASKVMTDSTKKDFESPLWDEQIWQKLDAEGSLKVSKIDDSATTREIMPKHEIQSESRQNDETENSSDLKNAEDCLNLESETVSLSKGEEGISEELSIINNVKVTFDENGGKLFGCNKCSYTAKQKVLAIRHVKVIHMSGHLPFKCDVCEFAAAQKRKLIQHIKLKHRHVATFMINSIDEESESTQSPSEEKAFQIIPSDNVEVKVDEDYRIEVLEVDGKNIKTFYCTKCKFTSKVKQTVINHIKVVHYGIKPYRCSECPYATGFKGNLKTHSVTHLKVQETKSEQDNNVKCGPNQITPDKIDSNSPCNKKLQSNDSKDEDTSKSIKVEFKDDEHDANEGKSHKEKILSDEGNNKNIKLEPQSDHAMESQDQNETFAEESMDNKNGKRYNCTKCKYSPKQKSQLMTHIKAVHYGLKPFKCDECSYSTGFKHTLKPHKKNRHKTDVVKPVGSENIEPTRNPNNSGIDQDMEETSSADKVKCQICSIKLAGETELTKHILDKHIG